MSTARGIPLGMEPSEDIVTQKDPKILHHQKHKRILQGWVEITPIVSEVPLGMKEKKQQTWYAHVISVDTLTLDVKRL